MKLAFVSSDWQTAPGRPPEPGGTNWWRMILPAHELAKHDHEVVHGAAVAGDGQMWVRDFQGDWHDDCDAVVLQRQVSEGMLPRVQRAVAAGQVVVNDVDDYFWALPRTSVTYRSRTRQELDLYRRILGASSALICSTPFLARAVERWGPPTFVCRNAIDVDRWRFGREGDHVGWVGAIPWRANDLAVLRPSVVPFLAERGIPFYHGGHVPSGKTAAEQLGYGNVATMPLCGMRDYPNLWGPLRVALVPLEDCTFNRAKSWCKPLEACARGIPFVASRLPEYEALGVGRLAKKRSEWVRHLEELMDPAVRAAEGAANRRRAEELSIRNQWHQWDAALREARRLSHAS